MSGNHAAKAWRKQRITQPMRQAVARRLFVEPSHWAIRVCHYCDARIVVDWTDPVRVRFLDPDGRPTPELDHVVPLALGGLHTVDNLVPACLSCNRKKGAKRIEGR